MINIQDNLHIVDNIIKTALAEDMPYGDATTACVIEGNPVSRAVFVAKQQGVVAGLDVAERVFKLLDAGIIFKKRVADGMRAEKGDAIAEVGGNTSAILKGERTALNFMQRLSGIATRTSQYCEKVKGLPVKITDTRKTTPGLRLLEKYAVKAGGGYNHRFSLSDGILIKDNHIKAAGGIKKAVELARGKAPHTARIEVETGTLEQVAEAVESGADIIMLDNMDTALMKQAVEIIGGRALIEASGNVSLDTVYEIALTGVDLISVGELTHSVKAMDISLKFIDDKSC